MQNILRVLIDAAKRQRIPFLVIGGYALQAYEVVRQTLDTDVLTSDAYAVEMDAILRGVGYEQLARSDIFARYRHASSALADVDVLFVDNDTAEEMVRQARECTLGGTTCLVPAFAHLLALKLHAIRNNPKRETRDLADIFALIRANPEAIDREALRGLCEKYAPAGLWEKLAADI